MDNATIIIKGNAIFALHMKQLFCAAPTPLHNSWL